MTSRRTRLAYTYALVLALLASAITACRKHQSSPLDEGGAPSPANAFQLPENAIASLPGPVYQAESDSSVRWQPWTQDALAMARESDRPIFAVVAMPQQPEFRRVLDSLSSDPAIVDQIHSTYVPVLVDGDATREIGLLTADLCEEIRRPLQLPLLLWITHEGNPLAWIPVPDVSPAAVRELFDHSHALVREQRRSDPVYMLENPRLDNERRRARLAKRRNVEVASDQPGEDALRATQKLVDLYDPVSRTLDEAGGLVPVGSIELLATASLLPGIPDGLRERSLTTIRDLLADLLPSPMFDPLDGGVFSSRRGLSWKFPLFNKDCPTQGRVASALIAAYRATGDPLALDRALAVIRHAESEFSVGEGLFAVGMSGFSDPEHWLWRVEDLEAVLSQEDAQWWIELTGMKRLGNVPFEDDPKRRFFRGNTLSIQASPNLLAARSPDPDAFAKRFENIRSRLLLARKERLGDWPRDSVPHASSTFRMISAYAAAFAATGDDEFREKAVASLAAARSTFADGPRLRAFPGEAPSSISGGRAFLYALAVHATLDVADITGDTLWSSWSEDLVATATELFTTDGYLKECPDDARVLDLPVTDLAMLFDNSTAGLFSLAESRLAARGQPLTAEFTKLATALPEFAQRWPMRFTDVILPTLIRHFGNVVFRGPDTGPELDAALQRLPLRVVGRRDPRHGDREIPAGGIVVQRFDGTRVPVDSPQSLREAALHAAHAQ
jgi:uncharacterized protein YyaL (SSP411 family)